MTAQPPLSSADGHGRGPGVRFPPPLVFVLPFAAAFFLNDRVEFLIAGGGAGPVQEMTGAALVAIGLLLMLWALGLFARFRTSVLPFRPARGLVTVPPYTFSRNPMYLGLLVAYLGGVLLTNWAWPLVFLPLVLWVMNGHIIAREERYLRAAFGEEYAAYCGRVRRWL